MAMDKKIRHAMKAGRQQADGVLRFRDKELLRRVKAVKRQPVAVRAARGPAPIAPKLVRAAGGPGSAGGRLSVMCQLPHSGSRSNP